MKHVTLGLEKKPDPELAGLDVEVHSKPQLRLGRLGGWTGRACQAQIRICLEEGGH